MHALNTTRAGGAVIVLRENRQFVCTASVGNAPVAGTVLRTRGGLFSECIEEKHLIVCNQEAGSKLQDLPSRQRINCASAAFIPFELEDEVEGLLAVFSKTPSAFRQPAVERLSAIAMVVESILFSAAFIRNGTFFSAPAEAPGEGHGKESTAATAPDEAQDFLAEVRATLPTGDGTAVRPVDAKAEADAVVESILARVRNELELLTGGSPRASGQTPQTNSFSLESTLSSEPSMDRSNTLGAFNFEDELRTPETRDQSKGERPASSRDSASLRTLAIHQEEETLKADVFEPLASPSREPLRRADASASHSAATSTVDDLLRSVSAAGPGQTNISASLAGESTADDSQAAVEELLQQAAPHIDSAVESSYLQQIENVLSQPQTPQPVREVKLPPLAVEVVPTTVLRPLPVHKVIAAQSRRIVTPIRALAVLVILAVLCAIVWFVWLRSTTQSQNHSGAPTAQRSAATRISELNPAALCGGSICEGGGA